MQAQIIAYFPCKLKIKQIVTRIQQFNENLIIITKYNEDATSIFSFTFAADTSDTCYNRKSN